MSVWTIYIVWFERSHYVISKIGIVYVVLTYVLMYHFDMRNFCFASSFADLNWLSIFFFLAFSDMTHCELQLRTHKPYFSLKRYCEILQMRLNASLSLIYFIWWCLMMSLIYFIWWCEKLYQTDVSDNFRTITFEWRN